MSADSLELAVRLGRALQGRNALDARNVSVEADVGAEAAELRHVREPVEVDRIGDGAECYSREFIGLCL